MAEQKAYYVYMVTNKSCTALYTGVTNSLMRRVCQHRRGESAGFTSRYNCNRLVFFEAFRDVANAIRREKEIKAWRREKKDALVASANPEWKDLSSSVLGLGDAPRRPWREIPRPKASG